MCTVSWTMRPEAYDLFFSRDEQRTRPLGEVPQLLNAGRTKILAPRDPMGGGSWIFSNEYGLSACILNAYPPTVSPSGIERSPRSRGRLLLDLAFASDFSEIDGALSEAVSANTYAACFIVAVSLKEGVGWWICNGWHLRRVSSPVRPPITTSSWDSERVCAQRQKIFQTMTRGSDAPAVDCLRAYHEATEQDADAFSVRMSRADARTVSLTHVAVCRSEVGMTYSARDGDDGFLPSEDLMIPRTSRRLTSNVLLPC